MILALCRSTLGVDSRQSEVKDTVQREACVGTWYSVLGRYLTIVSRMTEWAPEHAGVELRLGAALCCLEVLSKHLLIISGLASPVGAQESPGSRGGGAASYSDGLTSCALPPPALWELV